MHILTMGHRNASFDVLEYWISVLYVQALFKILKELLAAKMHIP